MQLLRTNSQVENGCYCNEDPTKPISIDYQDWHDHHANMRLDAIKATAKYTTYNTSHIKSSSSKLQEERRQKKPQRNGLDLVMLGDSIIERWNGTRNLGNVKEPAMREVYEKMFTKEGGGQIEALPLGIDGEEVRGDATNCMF